MCTYYVNLYFDDKDRDVWKRTVAHAVNRIEEMRMEDYQRRPQSRFGSLFFTKSLRTKLLACEH